MFGLKREPPHVTVAHQLSAIPPTPRPTAAVVTLEEGEVRAYTTLANKIGFEPAELLRARLMLFLHERGIPVFREDQVSEYLGRKARSENEKFRWWWRPLRETDVIATWQWGRSWESGSDNFYSSQEWVCRPYHRAVPLRVLSRVEQVASTFGDRLKFFVTDYGLKEDRQFAGRPDPFIAVTALDMGRVIFDVWDEPGFDVNAAQ